METKVIVDQETKVIVDQEPGCQTNIKQVSTHMYRHFLVTAVFKTNLHNILFIKIYISFLLPIQNLDLNIYVAQILIV